jgi:hypothetical protein
MNMTFKEKSAWISLLSTVCIFGYYFYNIFMLLDETAEVAKYAALGLLIYAVILSIIVEVFFQTVLAITHRKDALIEGDERDRSYEYRANSLAYSVLAFLVVITLVRIITLEYNPTWVSDTSEYQFPMLTAHFLMFSFILSEIVRFSGLIYYYRRGL